MRTITLLLARSMDELTYTERGIPGFGIVRLVDDKWDASRPVTSADFSPGPQRFRIEGFEDAERDWHRFRLLPPRHALSELRHAERIVLSMHRSGVADDEAGKFTALVDFARAGNPHAVLCVRRVFARGIVRFEDAFVRSSHNDLVRVRDTFLEYVFDRDAAQGYATYNLRAATSGVVPDISDPLRVHMLGLVELQIMFHLIEIENVEKALRPALTEAFCEHLHQTGKVGGIAFLLVMAQEGFLDRDADGRTLAYDQFTLTDKGKRLMSRISPALRDPDLLTRIPEWEALGLAASRPLIDVYAKRAHDIQKRHFATTGAEL